MKTSIFDAESNKHLRFVLAGAIITLRQDDADENEEIARTIHRALEDALGLDFFDEGEDEHNCLAESFQAILEKIKAIPVNAARGREILTWASGWVERQLARPPAALADEFDSVAAAMGLQSPFPRSTGGSAASIPGNGPLRLPHAPPSHPRFSKLSREKLARTTIVVGCLAGQLSGRDPAEVLNESLRGATHRQGEIRYRNVAGRGTVLCCDGAQVLQDTAESVGIDLTDDHQAEVFADFCQRCLESYEPYFHRK